jgi:hypothetical protein
MDDAGQLVFRTSALECRANGGRKSLKGVAELFLNLVVQDWIKGRLKITGEPC